MTTAQRMNVFRTNVFLAYSRTDGFLAKVLIAALERLGFSVWWDVESIPIGADWERQSQRVAALVQRLREFGWIESRNLTIEYRYAEGRNERYAELAAEFVRLNVDVIITYGTPAVAATKQATAVIPIVFAVAGDPVGSGLVASLPRPGGNLTGLSLQKNGCR